MNTGKRYFIPHFLIMVFLVCLSLGCGLFSFLEPAKKTAVPAEPGVTSEPGNVPAITLEGLYAEYAGEPQDMGGIGAYLNAGGAVERLQTLLTGIQTGTTEKIKAQILARDLTGDGCVDVIVSLALPTIPGYGDAIVAVYTCQGDQYVRHNLFGRVGAGSRGEGLFDGGGARIETVQDLNANGLPEILFFVPSLSELYIAAWDGAGFSSLVGWVDELGNPQSSIPAREGAFEIMDLDQDGVLEVMVTDPPSLWRWDGALFQQSG